MTRLLTRKARQRDRSRPGYYWPQGAAQAVLMERRFLLPLRVPRSQPSARWSLIGLASPARRGISGIPNATAPQAP